MPSCCYSDEYNSMFTSNEAARTATRFRKRGLSGSAAELAQAVKTRTKPGATMIEVGGGVGQLHVALLETGAVDRALNVELSDSWEMSAAALLTDRGLADRVERRIGDFVDIAADLPRADVVVMHRVLCCYPDWENMLTGASSRAKSLVGVTVPDNRWWNSVFLRFDNLWTAARGMQFRSFVHPIGDMTETMETVGFRVAFDRAHLVWRTIVFEKADPGT